MRRTSQSAGIPGRSLKLDTNQLTVPADHGRVPSLLIENVDGYKRSPTSPGESTPILRGRSWPLGSCTTSKPRSDEPWKSPCLPWFRRKCTSFRCRSLVCVCACACACACAAYVVSPWNRTLLVRYETSKTSTAVQWLAPSQTVTKKHPYLFTQCQAIHARSMVPCQDSPAVKCTYTAKVTVPAPLRAVMSATQQAEPQENPDQGTTSYFFEQKMGIPVGPFSWLKGLHTYTNTMTRTHTHTHNSHTCWHWRWVH